MLRILAGRTIVYLVNKSLVNGLIIVVSNDVKLWRLCISRVRLLILCAILVLLLIC